MVAGDVFVPGDGGYDEARRAWDLVVDQRPARLANTGCRATAGAQTCSGPQAMLLASLP
jgi:hypothetical protein